MVFSGTTSTTASFTTPVTGNNLFFSLKNTSGGSINISMKIDNISIVDLTIDDLETVYSNDIIRIAPTATVLLETTGLINYYMTVE